MACVSDIDLATLHRNRLEERVHYKLSWWARRMISNTLRERPEHGEERHHHCQRMVNCNTIPQQTTNNDGSHRQPENPTPHLNGLPPQSPSTKRGRRHTDRHRDLLYNNEKKFAIDNEIEMDTNKNELRVFENRFKDEDYFTTERRFRSGTWP